MCRAALTAGMVAWPLEGPKPVSKALISPGRRDGQGSLACCSPWGREKSSMGFPRQEYWSGLPFPSPGYLPNLEIEPKSPTLHTDSLWSEPPGKPLYMYSSLYLLI